MGADYPEILEDLAANSADVLRAEGLPESRAREVGFKIAERARENWGGQLIYVPLGKGLKAAQRDAEIFLNFTGHNYAALAIEYKLSLQTVYQIIKRMKKNAGEKNKTPTGKGSA